MKTNQKIVDLKDTYFPVMIMPRSGPVLVDAVRLHKHIVLFSGMFTWGSPGLRRLPSIWNGRDKPSPLHTLNTKNTRLTYGYSSEGRKNKPEFNR